ncbi:cyd operon YbgE family protein [Halioxenophilus sp. WMMB6]|uniref:cyd operon YbgE family protein n=1 Tax=Halioxenophilus sp. WMMB6 TaxID=3073815 RepID=UPI00295F10EA|nr:cyd operon YbgE family protein [Halioxenophilus sp. WMMB6]
MKTSTEMLKSEPVPWYKIAQLNYGTCRLVSLFLAAGLSLVVLVAPWLLSAEAGAINHGLLAMVFWGISVGFVHGVGYVPVAQFWQWALNPLLAWMVMAWTTVLVARALL